MVALERAVEEDTYSGVRSLSLADYASMPAVSTGQLSIDGSMPSVSTGPYRNPSLDSQGCLAALHASRAPLHVPGRNVSGQGLDRVFEILTPALRSCS